MANNKSKMRPIRFDQFQKQLEEIGISNLQEVQLSAEESIFIRLGNSIDSEDEEDFQNRLVNAADTRDACLVILDYYDKATAEEQMDLYESHGGTPDQLAALFGSATADQKDRLGKLRPRRA